jgi:hypothetical protein
MLTRDHTGFADAGELLPAPWGAIVMRYFHTLLSACASVAIAGCGQAEQADEPVRQAREPAKVPAPATIPQRPKLMLDGRGLVMSDAQGRKRTIAFDSPASEAVAAATQLYGEPAKVETLEECGAGPLQISRFPGLTLAAQDGEFVGWWLDDNAKPPLPTTAAGIGIGSSREALQRAHKVQAHESSLGDEFTADGIAGLTDGPGKQAKITHLWAGATCIMR